VKPGYTLLARHRQRRAGLGQLEAQRREITAQIAAGRTEALAEIVGQALSQAEQIGVAADELAQAFGFGRGGKH